MTSSIASNNFNMTGVSVMHLYMSMLV